MTSGSVIGGSGVTGLIVCGPVPEMLKLIASGTLAVEFADRMACRNEPAPLSLVLVTGKVAPPTGPGMSARHRPARVAATRIEPLIVDVFMVIDSLAPDHWRSQ